MLFNSPDFIFAFLPLTLLVVFILNRQNHYWAIAWLINASLFFYGYWNSSYLIFILFSIVFNYSIAYLILRFLKSIQIAKKILILGIIINLGILGYFKYTNFFLANISGWIGVNFDLESIILPLGISFITFEQISYLIDIYNGKIEKKFFLHYCFFITFFPYLISGPIVKYKEISSQLLSKQLFTFNIENLAVGITIFSIGLFKKVVLADNLSDYANPVFYAAEQMLPITTFEAWSGVIAYSFQLYFDFSGYSDMAIGIARMFGVILPLNFYSPYKSINIIDFWRRWHITLSRFLKDYLYIPLGGNRQGKFRQYVNLIITMLLGGIWHGANWNFLIWGGLHGVYLVINHAWHNLLTSRGYDINKSNWYAKIIGQSLTLIAVIFAWVFFRTDTVKGAIYLATSLINFKSLFSGTQGFLLLHLSILGVIIFFLPNTNELMKNYQPSLETYKNSPSGLAKIISWSPQKIYSIGLGFMWFFILLELFSSSQSQFIYFQF